MASERATGIEGSCSPTVICLGETMVMFAPSPNELIEYSNNFTSLLGGSEANVAIGLERLGVHAGWIGKLPNNALGRKLVNETRSFGVDTSAVIWAGDGRVGTFFVEWASRPRRISTIYDRANSAATTLTADDLDWEYVRGARWLHLTGISPALSETCRVSTREIASRARSLGVRISFDANFRSLLWSEEAARSAWAEILPSVDLLISTESDAAIILGTSLPREDALRSLVARFGLASAVMTLGVEGSLAFDGDSFYRSTGYEVQTVNRLGAGDAFAAGLLYGYLKSGLQSGLDYGSAMAALKMTVPQNIPLATRDEVERLLANRKSDLLR